MSVGIDTAQGYKKCAGSYVVDNVLDVNSNNPVTNRVVTTRFNQIANELSEKVIATSTTTTRGADLLSLKTV